MNDLDFGEQPHCPQCGTTLRDVKNGYVCRACNQAYTGVVGYPRPIDRRAPGEMTTREAVAYLNEWLDSSISPDIIHSLRVLGLAPAAEKLENGRLVFRRPALDAYLAEFGTDPTRWTAGVSRPEIEKTRALDRDDADIEAMFRGIDPEPDGWHPAGA